MPTPLQRSQAFNTLLWRWKHEEIRYLPLAKLHMMMAMKTTKSVIVMDEMSLLFTMLYLSLLHPSSMTLEQNALNVSNHAIIITRKRPPKTIEMTLTPSLLRRRAFTLSPYSLLLTSPIEDASFVNAVLLYSLFKMWTYVLSPAYTSTVERLQ